MNFRKLIRNRITHLLLLFIIVMALRGTFLQFLLLAILLIIITTKGKRIEKIYPNPPLLICPHCHTQGSVITQRVKRKQGISGGKATAAILTGFLSLFFVGLSRKERKTQAHCHVCGMTWDF